MKKLVKNLHKMGKWTAVAVLMSGGAVVGTVGSLVVGGMGLALMGTAIGVGPVGWAALGVTGGLAVYGGASLLRRKS